MCLIQRGKKKVQTLLEDIKEDFKKWKYTPFLDWKSPVVRIPILTKWIYISVIPKYQQLAHRHVTQALPTRYPHVRLGLGEPNGKAGAAGGMRWWGRQWRPQAFYLRPAAAAPREAGAVFLATRSPGQFPGLPGEPPSSFNKLIFCSNWHSSFPCLQLHILADIQATWTEYKVQKQTLYLQRKYQ